MEWWKWKKSKLEFKEILPTGEKEINIIKFKNIDDIILKLTTKD